MSILGNDLLLAGTDEGYNLTRSLRFRSSASAYLSRTPAVGGNQQKWTWGGWVKRGLLSSAQNIFMSGSAAQFAYNYARLVFRSDDCLEFIGYDDAGGVQWDLTTTQVFRDPSSWYHVLVSIDTTNATSSNRVSIYINGTKVTAFKTGTFSTTYPSLNTNSWVNTTTYPFNISRHVNSIEYLDGYLAEVNFIDGQALTPSSFGETDIITGVWKPKRYAGTYGTNGFYLPFTDNSALTTSSNAGLGKDFSGNGNYWTTNNISITSGVTYDSMTDVPTLTSATAANFCIANPLDKQTDISVTQGNLQISTTAGAGNKQIRGSIALPSSGKFYWETKNTGSVNNFNMGLTTLTASLSTEGAGDMFYNEGGVIGNNGTNTSGYATLALNDTVGVAVDIDANKIYWYKNNTLVNSGGTTINITAPFAPMFGLYDNGNAQSITFGQRPFTYTPPTGYVALNTYNLPTSTIVKGNTVMDATLWTGNSTGSTTQTITNAGGFKPDFLWGKSRSAAYNHVLIDSVRGVTKLVYSDLTNAEVTNANALSSFNSNGFTVGTDAGGLNDNGKTFVGWQWQAGQGTTSSNTNGTITSTVSVNASAGFSVVTWTGNGTVGATIGHGLGVAPSLIIVKSKSAVTSWGVYHSALGNTGGVYLNDINAFTVSNQFWNNTSPTSSVFSVNNNNINNANATTYVAYCWTPIAGYSAFGSYTGTANADGPMIYTGFKPKLIMTKRTDSTSAWYLFDSARNPYNVVDGELSANTSGAEATGSSDFDFLSNGFKCRNTSAGTNASGGTYIYMAFAETPTKFALAR